MNVIFIVFWAVMVFASVAWYAFLLFYVGYKGGKEVLALARRDPESGSTGEPDEKTL